MTEYKPDELAMDYVTHAMGTFDFEGKGYRRFGREEVREALYLAFAAGFSKGYSVRAARERKEGRYEGIEGGENGD